MIRPLHYILNGKQLTDLVAPISGKAEELEAFAEVQQEQAKAERARADAAYQQARAAFGVACAKATQRSADAAAALAVASTIRRAFRSPPVRPHELPADDAVCHRA